jgi:hypothetical protein
MSDGLTSSSIDEIDSDIKLFIYPWTILFRILYSHVDLYSARLGFYVYRSILEKLDCCTQCCVSFLFLFALRKYRETSSHFLKRNIKRIPKRKTAAINRKWVVIGSNEMNVYLHLDCTRWRPPAAHQQTFNVYMLGYYWLLLFLTDFVSRIPYSYSDLFI